MRATMLVFLTLSACGGLNVPKPVDTDETPDDCAPTLTFDAESVDFGEIGFEELVQKTATLRNGGCTPLVVSSITVDPPFRVTPSNLTIVGGGSQQIIVFAQLTTYEDFAVAITLVTDDPDVGTVPLPVMAGTIRDADGDGYDLVEGGGDDCDDSDAAVHPGADEIWYDDADQNCDGANDHDQDGDGYDTEDDGDCQDTSVEFHPGAADAPYDGRDTNCDGLSDYDWDQDGYGSAAYGEGSDCDDFDATVNIASFEVLNGKDDDCDGETDAEAVIDYAPYFYESDGSYDRVGWSMAIGDLDDDGDAELIVGAPYHGATTSSASGSGIVGIFEGGVLSATGTDIDRGDNSFEGDGSTDLLGTAVSVIGDYDGDGENDLAIAATGAYGGGGLVYVFAGDDALNSNDLGDAMATYSATNGASGMGRGFGTQIDLDADGLDDLVALYANGPTNCIALQYGDASPISGTTADMDALYSGTGSEAAFYRNAPVGGDLDGDGYEDLVLSDGNADYQGRTDSGTLWVLWGQGDRYRFGGALDSSATGLIVGDSTSDYDAWSSQLGDDWDGDGDNELWVYNVDEALYVIEGGADLRAGAVSSSNAAVTYTWDTSSPDAELIRRLGDYTGDGVSEMIVFLEDASGHYGEVEVFSSEERSGRLDELDDRIGDMEGSEEHESGNMGWGMPALPGDLDGDGDDDFAVGDAECRANEGEAAILLNGLIYVP